MPDIDLVNAARLPLYAYLQQGGRDQERPFVFTSQSAARLAEPALIIGSTVSNCRLPRRNGS